MQRPQTYLYAARLLQPYIHSSHPIEFLHLPRYIKALFVGVEMIRSCLDLWFYSSTIYTIYIRVNHSTFLSIILLLLHAHHVPNPHSHRTSSTQQIHATTRTNATRQGRPKHTSLRTTTLVYDWTNSNASPLFLNQMFLESRISNPESWILSRISFLSYSILLLFK
jgi:hypothetical protein